ncbi:Uncharacterised protein [Lacrimispora sphenoides]|nr:hypothetical protein [Lacrimispora sphenoides]SUY50697.1 Uncharacterised protein [Lacrimispora sphenoides]
MVYDEEKIMVNFDESFCHFSDVSAKIFTQDIYDAYQTFCMRQKVQAIAVVRPCLLMGQSWKSVPINIQLSGKNLLEDGKTGCLKRLKL